MTTPTYVLEVDWAGGAGEDEVAFANSGDNITADAFNIECRRGRDYASQLVGRSDAGKLTAVLNNQDGRYSPFNTSSPLAGLMLPGREVRLRAGIPEVGVAASFVAANSPEMYANGVNDILDSAFEIVVWVKAASLPTAGNTMALIGQWITGIEDFLLFIDNTAGTIRFKWSVRDAIDTTTTTVTASTFGTPSTDTWYMVHVYHDPTGNVIGIQVNNGTANTAAHAGGMRDGGPSLQIGSSDDPPANFFDGAIDETSIWFVESGTTLLTSDQLAYLYNAGEGRHFSTIGMADTDGSGLKDTLARWYSFGDEVGIAVERDRWSGEGSETAVDWEWYNNRHCESINVETTTGLTTLMLRPIWSGYLDSIQPTVSAGPYKTATLSATGVLSKFSLVKPHVVYVGQTFGDTLGGVAGYVPVDEAHLHVGAGVATGVVAVFASFENSALEAVRQLEDTEQGFLYELKASSDGGPGPGFQGRNFRLEGDLLVSQATFSDDPLDALHYTAILEEDLLRGIFNYVSANGPLYDFTSELDALLWDEGLAPVDVPPSQFTHLVTFSVPNAVTPDGTVFATGNVDVTANVTPGALGVDVLVFADANGTEVQVMVVNISGVTQSVELLTVSGDVAITEDQPQVAAAADDDSQGTYGVRSLALGTTWFETIDQAQAFCDYAVSLYKDPMPVLAMTFVASKSDAYLAQALERDLSDRITLVADNSTDLGIDEDFFIESIHHRIEFGGMLHTVEFELSPASVSGGYWVLGVSELGLNTRPYF